jgi:hypothetical protein
MKKADLLLLLQKLAERTTWQDREDFDPYDMSGGNFDDTYTAGCTDGETILAQEILEHLQNLED